MSARAPRRFRQAYTRAVDCIATDFTLADISFRSFLLSLWLFHMATETPHLEPVHQALKTKPYPEAYNHHYISL